MKLVKKLKKRGVGQGQEIAKWWMSIPDWPQYINMLM
jgi:hypothetical protein